MRDGGPVERADRGSNVDVGEAVFKACEDPGIRPSEINGYGSHLFEQAVLFGTSVQSDRCMERG